MKMSTRFDPGLPEPQQRRSRQTQQSFVEAGWAIMQEQPWDSVSITEIAKRAQRSVGTFYQRFGSKADFLNVLLIRWLERGYAMLNEPIDCPDGESLIRKFLADGLNSIRRNRFLWRAAMQRTLDDPQSWEHFRRFSERRRDRYAGLLGELRGRPVDATERTRFDLAGQVFNSVINNTLLNDPGPLHLDQPEFLPTLEQIFLKVADLQLDR